IRDKLVTGVQTCALPICLQTVIAAPKERVFDLARSIDAHQDTAEHTGERAVAGVTSGLLGPEEEVTWEARHFGVRQRLRVKMTRSEERRVGKEGRTGWGQ